MIDAMRKSVKLTVAGSMLALALLYCGVGYFTGAVPFPAQQRGGLTAGDLCESMGDDTETAEQLRAVLPAKGTYASSGQSPPRRGDDTSWRSRCGVSGDGDQLLYSSAELGWDASAKEWLDDPSRNYVRHEGRGSEFQAGNAAVVMKETAQILVPCLPRTGKAPYQIVVETHAQQSLAGSPEENRQALATVALGTARAAHERAECTLPSKLPEKAASLD